MSDLPPPLPPDEPKRVQPTLGYQTRRVEVSSGSIWPQLWLGLGFGAVISVLVWGAGWDALDAHGMGAALLIVPAVKLVAAIVLMCFARYRGLGAGLLISICLGGLIFFGNCVAHLK